MLFNRNNHLITDKEAKVLCEAIEERGKLEFPLSTISLGLVAGTIYSAQNIEGEFKPTIRQKIFSKLNYSYASVASFLLWIGPKNIVLKPGYSEKSGKKVLVVALKEGCKINWEELKSKKFSSPLIS